MLSIYDELFGRYPFWEDGYKLVEDPYLGMEHQSAIAYGNKYKMGYLGRQMEGVNFDYIIIHELMHLKELNHSPRYWRRVAEACPHYEKAETWLKTNFSLLG